MKNLSKNRKGVAQKKVTFKDKVTKHRIEKRRSSKLPSTSSVNRQPISEPAKTIKSARKKTIPFNKSIISTLNEPETRTKTVKPTRKRKLSAHETKTKPILKNPYANNGKLSHAKTDTISEPWNVLTCTETSEHDSSANDMNSDSDNSTIILAKRRKRNEKLIIKREKKTFSFNIRVRFRKLFLYETVS